MARHSFIQIEKIKDVKGRINYISSHERQENLYASFNTTDMQFWRELSKESQKEFRKSGAVGTCIEARELIIALPESYYEQHEPRQVLAVFTSSFKKTHGVECVSALHHNKRKTNYHIHLIFSERKMLPVPEVKIASRNMFYNEQGKHVRTKKEILNEEGEVRPGCRIIGKGQVYEERLFTNKEPRFKSEQFLNNEKKRYTELINHYIENTSEKLEVFNHSGIYLPTKKIGKNNPKAAEIHADNETRIKWNQKVDMALIEGVPEKEIQKVKKEEISQKVWRSIQEYGRKPGLFRSIVIMAMDILGRLIQKLKLPPKPKLTVDIQEFREMKYIYEKLVHQHNAIKVLENQELPELERRMEKLSRFFKGKERKEVEKQIEEAKSRAESMKGYLFRIVSDYGYESVQDFVEIYRKSESLVLQYQQEIKRWEDKAGQTLAGKASIRERLRQLQEDRRESKLNPANRCKQEKGAR